LATTSTGEGNLADCYTRLNLVVDASTIYTDNSVQGGQLYFYVVTAVEGSGKESIYSNRAQAAIPTP